MVEKLLSHEVDNVRFDLLTELLDRLGLEDILIQQLTVLFSLSDLFVIKVIELVTEDF